MGAWETAAASRYARGAPCRQGRGSQGPRSEKKEVAWQVVHRKMSNNGQREDQCL